MLVLSSLSATTALADEPQNITVVLTEYKFAPDTITLTVGQPVQLNVQNQGKADHNLSSDDLPLTNITYQKADNSESDLRGYVANNVLNADALSGHTSVVTFTPTRAGSFGFFSEDEASLGMVGKFLVVAPGSQATPAPPAAASAGTSSPTVARDGQSLASQSAATQAMFTAVWGNRAAEEWVQEHNATLPR
ncbi:MAG TPA: cupredoxin domain-containing protein [Chloroflexota bacterium]